ncbi:MAG: hypothetical protein ACOCYV_02645 [Planctomycetota bacterium]
MHWFWLLCLGPLLLLGACATQPPAEQLHTTLGDMIRLVEDGAYEQLITAYVDPDWIEAQGPGGLSDWRTAVSGPRRYSFHIRLCLAYRSEPQFGPGGRRAAFTAGELAGQPLVFRLRKGVWYLQPGRDRQAADGPPGGP